MLFIVILIPEEPKIIKNPVDAISERSNNAEFTVEAAGYGNFTYQWYHNGAILSSEMDRRLYISTLMDQDAGLYYCRVCNSDNHCVSSKEAELTITCTYVCT